MLLGWPVLAESRDSRDAEFNRDAEMGGGECGGCAGTGRLSYARWVRTAFERLTLTRTATISTKTNATNKRQSASLDQRGWGYQHI